MHAFLRISSILCTTSVPEACTQQHLAISIVVHEVRWIFSRSNATIDIKVSPYVPQNRYVHKWELHAGMLVHATVAHHSSPPAASVMLQY
jgi:hypothetical protein